MENEVQFGKSEIDNPELWESPADDKSTENRVIFESEEEAHNFCVDMQFNNVLIVKQVMREKGYIRKSIVEEAEEMYNKMLRDSFSTSTAEYKHNLITKQHEAIQELKSEIERLKK